MWRKLENEKILKQRTNNNVSYRIKKGSETSFRHGKVHSRRIAHSFLSKALQRKGGNQLKVKKKLVLLKCLRFFLFQLAQELN